MNEEDFVKIKADIDNIKEYISTEICKKCEEMFSQLEKYQKILNQYTNNQP
jgi:hypothetical protein